MFFSPTCSFYGIDGFFRGPSARFYIISTIFFIGINTISSMSLPNLREAAVSTTQVNKVMLN